MIKIFRSFLLYVNVSVILLIYWFIVLNIFSCYVYCICINDKKELFSDRIYFPQFAHFLNRQFKMVFVTDGLDLKLTYKNLANLGGIDKHV